MKTHTHNITYKYSYISIKDKMFLSSRNSKFEKQKKLKNHTSCLTEIVE
jgi:hypothetical protein